MSVTAEITPQPLGNALSARARLLAQRPPNPLPARAARLPDVISLGRGDPDLPPPAHVLAAAQAALVAGQTGYTHPNGLLELRQAIAAKLERDNGLARDPEAEIVVTAGAQEACFVAVNALLDPGDELLAPDPRFYVYDQAVAAAGGRLVSVPTYPEDGFNLRPDEVAARIGPRTKAIALISPGNPTGAVYPLETLLELGRLAQQHDLVLISDEIYEKLVFDGAHHVSIASLPGLAERTVLINGFSKSYCMTGWRVGYLAVPPVLAEAFASFHYALTICAPSFAPRGALAALEGPPDSVLELVAEYDRRRKLAIPAFEALGLPCPPTLGSFYLFPDIRPTGLSSEAFARELLEEARVLVHPGTVFGECGEGFLRVALLQPLDRLEQALGRLADFMRRRGWA